MEKLKLSIKKSIILREKIINFTKEINLIIEKIFNCLKNDNKIFICGNGGSAADAQHISTEFLVRLNPKINRQSYPIICLGNDMTYLTACGNDYGFEKIFSRPFEALVNKNDILVIISTSGNSKNIIEILIQKRVTK